ncbi:cytochrome P450 protein [Rutstroemia sp. NJR-2017a BVV2]|nr:cytochrome P450 protein [Rutstroemia sp. NJR-2017a BVV2]
MDIPNSLFEIAVHTLSIIISLTLFVISYQLVLHPLKNYPGPFIAKFADGYGGYQAVKKRLHLATYHDHLKYGPVFRQAPNRLVFNTSSALRTIYLHPAINKASIYKHTQFNSQINIFGTLDREPHRQKRKIYGQVLSERSLRSFEPTMSSEIDILLHLLLDTKTEAINMSLLCKRLTTDIAGQLAFGQGLNTQAEAINRVFPRAMISMNALVNIFMSWPSSATTWPLLKRLNKKNGLAFAKSIPSIVQKRIALPKDAKHDLYSIAGDVGPGGEGLGRSELLFFNFLVDFSAFVNIGQIFLGGTTLSAALSAIFFYLSRNPIAYSRLATEICTTFSSSHDIKSGPQLFKCKYLRASIDETLRIAPPFLGTFWREPCSYYSEPFVVDGHFIPLGTMVGVNPYCVMHNEEYFPEPFLRFGRRTKPSCHAHSICTLRTRRYRMSRTLGKAMAYHEMSLVVAKTLWYFDFAKAPGEAGKLGEGRPGSTDGIHRVSEYQLYDLAVADHDGPNLVFTPRGEFWRELDNEDLKG